MKCLSILQGDLIQGHSKIVIFPNWDTLSGWGERVTCRGSKLTNSLGKQQLELSARTWSGRSPWNRGKFVSQPASSKQFLRRFFSIFELGGITKQLMTGPAGNSEFCFPSTSVFPLTKPRGTLKTRGNKTLCFPVGPVVKCLKLPQEIWKRCQFKYFLCHAGLKSSTWIFLAIERPPKLFAVF